MVLPHCFSSRHESLRFGFVLLGAGYIPSPYMSDEKKKNGTEICALCLYLVVVFALCCDVPG